MFDDETDDDIDRSDSDEAEATYRRERADLLHDALDAEEIYDLDDLETFAATLARATWPTSKRNGGDE